MSRLAIFLPFLLCLASTHAARTASAADVPHILYVTADDLGWKDVGYHGSTIRTPNIDRLAKEGARLESFYVQPFSSQTRAAAMTGRYPMRYGLQTMQIQWFSDFGLPDDERMLPQALKSAGYRTALIGKWHLGHARKEMLPNARGYDHFYGHLGGEIDYTKRTDRGGRPDWWRNDKRVKEDGHVNALLAREAENVIGRHDTATPLYLHLSLAAPQAPHQGVKPFIDYYHADNARLKAYRAMVTSMDDTLGKALAALEKRGMLERTLVVFHANSGGAVHRKFPMGEGDSTANVANNGPYRDGRGSLYEGALRVVALVWQPGSVPSATIAAPMHAVDLYPTLLGRAGALLQQDKPVDGIDQWATIQGQPTERKEILLNVEEFRGALRMGDWKLILHATLPGKVELYNLRADPSEEDNQAERDPERARTMSQQLVDFAWEMAPALYLEDLTRARKVETPMVWGENPMRE